MMKNLLTLLTTLSLVIVFTLGCSEATPTASTDLTKVLYRPGMLCGECGQLKGTEACCSEGAEVCTKCSLQKGAPGCCKMEKGSNVMLCAACGEIKGTEACCAEGAETCSKCQLNKGAPGCCKLERTDADAALEHKHEQGDHDAQGHVHEGGDADSHQHEEGAGHDGDADHEKVHDDHEGHDIDN